MPIHIVAIVDLQAADLRLFDRYEAEVLPLLADHGGELLNRLRSLDGSQEVHVIRFASDHHYERYLADRRRSNVAGWLEASAARVTSGRFEPLG